MTLTNKDIAKLKIAFAIDDYYYNKDSKSYFDKMPLIGLADSQTIFVNEYLKIIEDKDISNDFEKLLVTMKRENDNFKKLLESYPNNTYYKRNIRILGYIIRTMEKYKKTY